jgi:hypothetical protein
MVRSVGAARRWRGVAAVPVRVRNGVADGYVFTGPELHDQPVVVSAREVETPSPQGSWRPVHCPPPWSWVWTVPVCRRP